MHSPHQKASSPLQQRIESSPRLSPSNSSMDQLLATLPSLNLSQPTTDMQSPHQKVSSPLRQRIELSPRLSPSNSSISQLPSLNLLQPATDMQSPHQRESSPLRQRIESSPRLPASGSSIGRLLPTLPSFNLSQPAADMHSPHQKASSALRQRIESSPRLSPSDSSITQLLATVPTTSLQKKKRGFWFFRNVVSFRNRLKSLSFKKKLVEQHLRLQDTSATSPSINEEPSRSSWSSQYANTNRGELPKCTVFTMAEIQKATNNFSPALKIGEGGFGTVYRGKLADGRPVAIKQARKVFQNASQMQLSVEFHNEVTALSNIEHLNLVKLVGYLNATPERILVVEYVDNGNLRQHLDGQFGTILDLARRLDIVLDVAHAVNYLHNYADRPIIHRDIKASNILLTKNFRAKVADFGFSHLGAWGENATHVSTQIRGTAGYLDPEYLKTYQLTHKSDVYSFGVLLVEIFTGRSPIQHKQQSKAERITTKWAFEKLKEGKAIDVLDPNLERSPAAEMLVEKMLEVALQCTASIRQQRPSMSKTTQLLWSIRKDFKNLCRDHSLEARPSLQTPPSSFR